MFKGINKIDAEVQKAVEAKKAEMEGIEEYVETCVEYGICPRCGRDLTPACMIRESEELGGVVRTIGPKLIITGPEDLRVIFGVQCVWCGWLNMS